MGEYMWGVGYGQVAESAKEEIERIAKECGGYGLSNPNLPGDGYRYWFSGPNLGSPFDDRLARETTDALKAAGLLTKDGTLPLEGDDSDD